jgi:malate synthase
VHYRVELDTGAIVTTELVQQILDEEAGTLASGLLADDKDLLDAARTLFAQVALAPDFADFLTIPAYDLLD